MSIPTGSTWYHTRYEYELAWYAGACVLVLWYLSTYFLTWKIDNNKKQTNKTNQSSFPFAITFIGHVNRQVRQQ